MSPLVLHPPHSVLLCLRSTKGGYCSMSDDLSCSHDPPIKNPYSLNNLYVHCTVNIVCKQLRSNLQPFISSWYQYHEVMQSSDIVLLFHIYSFEIKEVQHFAILKLVRTLLNTRVLKTSTAAIFRSNDHPLRLTGAIQMKSSMPFIRGIVVHREKDHLKDGGCTSF